MALTNFSNGISSFGIPLIGSGPILTTGKVFFVDSNNAGGQGTKARPFATIDEAVGNCTANKGDFIIVMPGHVETLTAAGQLVLDVAGITVYGLGTGSLQPQVVHDTAIGADVDIDAANVTIHNLHFVASFADVTASIDLNAADCWLSHCRWTDEGANLNFVDYILGPGDNVADGLKVTDCWAVGADAANDGFLNCVGDIDRLVFQRNFVKLNVATTEPVIEVTGKSLTNCLITNNFISRANTSGIIFVDSDQTDNSGIIAYNAIDAADVAAATPIDLTGAAAFENYYTGEADASGLLLPAVYNDA